MAIAFDTQIAGEAVIDGGFEAFKTVEGLGIITAGFLWPREGIWAPGETDAQNVTWGPCPDDGPLGAYDF